MGKIVQESKAILDKGAQSMRQDSQTSCLLYGITTYMKNAANAAPAKFTAARTCRSIFWGLTPELSRAAKRLRLE